MQIIGVIQGLCDIWSGVFMGIMEKKMATTQNKGYRILGSIWRSPCFGKVPPLHFRIKLARMSVHICICVDPCRIRSTYMSMSRSSCAKRILVDRCRVRGVSVWGLRFGVD